MKAPTINIQEIKNAASFLRGWFSDQKGVSDFILKTIREEGREWYAAFHMNWGMNIRNLLRANGYTEEALGIRNLDDIYHILVEFVIPTMGYSLTRYLVSMETMLDPNARRAISSAEIFYRKQGV